MKMPASQLQVAKIVGENDDGLTLFVPKSPNGTFHVENGDRFLTLVFVRSEGGTVVPWVPWDESGA